MSLPSSTLYPAGSLFPGLAPPVGTPVIDAPTLLRIDQRASALAVARRASFVAIGEAATTLTITDRSTEVVLDA